MDLAGYAYASALLGTSLNWNGSTFTFGAAETADAVSGATIALPAGNDSTLNLLAATINGNQPNQIFIVNYTDGSSSSFTQSMSDWYTPANYRGESQALKMPYRIGPTGAIDNSPCMCTATPSPSTAPRPSRASPCRRTGTWWCSASM